MQQSCYSRPNRLVFLVAAILCFVSAIACGSTNTIHSFTGGSTDGANPWGGLTLDASGNLYGTTSKGGSGRCPDGCGTVYRLSPSAEGWTESILYNFQGASIGDGSNPEGPLVVDASGNFFGYTEAGGSRALGTVYELSPETNGTWTEKVLYSFGSKGFDGFYPIGSLAFDPSGNLWVATWSGGSTGQGTIVELVPSSSGVWTESVVYSFPNIGKPLGINPGGIIFDAAGNLYGVTVFGGTTGHNGAGVVFQLVKSNGLFGQKILHRFPTFSTTALQTPTGGLLLDPSGTLYMTMSRGGNGGAGVSALNLNTLTVTDLYSSDGPQTIQPYEALVRDSAGNLFSASFYSKNGNEIGFKCPDLCGFVYELSHDGSNWNWLSLGHFIGDNGSNPTGGVTIDASGNLFGVTYQGGTNNLGVVYEVSRQ